MNIYLIRYSLKSVNPQATANPIEAMKNITRMMIFPVDISITKNPNNKEKIPPIRIVHGTTFVGKN